MFTSVLDPLGRDFVSLSACLENLLLSSSIQVLFVGGSVARLCLSLHFTEGGQARGAGLGLDPFQV